MNDSEPSVSLTMYIRVSECPLWVVSEKFSPKCLDLTIGDGYRPEADSDVSL